MGGFVDQVYDGSLPTTNNPGCWQNEQGVIYE